MNTRSRFTTFLIASLFCTTTSVSAQLSPSRAGAGVGRLQTKPAPPILAGEPEYVPGELLVKFKETTRAKSINRAHEALGAKVAIHFKFVGVDHVKLREGMQVTDAITAYQALSEVEYAEPNYYLYAQSLPSEPVIPTDPRFSDQWGLHNTGQTIQGVVGTYDADIDGPEAWRYPTSGEEVIVAVLDSGVGWFHPDLGVELIWQNPDEIWDDWTDNDGNGYVDDTWGWDFVDGDPLPLDQQIHGSHVAGIIGALHNNSFGVAGTAPGLKILPVRVADTFGGLTVADDIAALQYVKDLKDRGHPISVMNVSYAGLNSSDSQRDAIALLRDSGILFCAAAGNNPPADNDTDPMYPASYDLDNIISVAASDSQDELAEFSHWGATSVDVAAPGTAILSSVPYRVEVMQTCDDPLDWIQVGWPLLWGIENVSDSNVLSDSLGTFYANNSNTLAYSIFPLDISDAIGIQVAFDAMFDLEVDPITGLPYDWVTLELSTDGIVFIPYDIYYRSPLTGGPFDRVYGRSAFWLFGLMDHFESEYIPNFEAPQLYAGFRLVSDSIGVRDGVYVDNLQVRLFPDKGAFEGSEVDFVQGTSMACPMVAGAAAFLKMVEPGLAYTQIKALILDNVDPMNMPEGKATVTNGRLNLHSAVRMIDYDDDDMILEHELEYGTDPHKSDTDGDGLSDSVEDANSNGEHDSNETNALQDDTDGDGLADGVEDENHNGIVDEGETDPRKPDIDGDGVTDGDEIAAGTDPLDGQDFPRPPEADFTADVTSGYAPLTVHFTDLSTNEPTSWAWDFDNDGGADSTTQDPTHTFTVPGTYAVKLTGANSYGSDTETKSGYITVNAKVGPTTAFSATPDSGHAPLEVAFQDQSDAGTATITSREWSFGDGNTSTEQNPIHTYEDAGTYTVSLTVSTDHGTDTETRMDYISVSAASSERGNINADGVVNAIDVQLVINAALGIDTGFNCDIDSNGIVNAVDVQLVINGALGINGSG